MITLSANADFGHSGQYVARITGRDAKFTFRREFIGRKGGRRGDVTTADVDEPGLYECCNVERKAGKVSRFYILVEVADTLRRLTSDKEDAMVLAKRLGAGEQLGDMLAVTSRPGDSDPEKTIFEYEILTAAQAKRQQAAATVETAVEACCQAVEALPAAEVRKVLTALRARLKPAEVGTDGTKSTDQEGRGEQ